jgi:hypothetical protein
VASSPVDVRGMQARQLIERIAQRGQGGQGGPGGQPGAPGAGSPDAAGQQLSQQMSELKGADPQLLVKAAEQMKAMSLAIQVRTAFQVPGASRHFAKAIDAINSGIKELQQAAATANTVSSPIVNSAGMNPTQPSGNSPAGPEGMAV